MKKIQQWFNEVLGMSYSEANGFMILAIICLLIYGYREFRSFTDESEFQNQHDKIVAERILKKIQQSMVREDTVSYFKFDPNILSFDSLILLGIDKKTASTIVKYRERGGVFKSSDDLLKIYGIDTGVAKRLAQFVDIQRIEREKRRFDRRKEKIKFDINRADEARLISVYGIGPVLARRIISYKNLLGGFVETDQLNEVWGLDSSVCENLKKEIFIAGDFQPEKIELNKMNFSDLLRHPYLSKSMVRSILAHREKEGKIPNSKKLIEIGIDSAKLYRIKPYLSFD
jgi:DNA uptake protein ComE-like DNA-binding protein